MYSAWRNGIKWAIRKVNFFNDQSSIQRRSRHKQEANNQRGPMQWCSYFNQVAMFSHFRRSIFDGESVPSKQRHEAEIVYGTTYDQSRADRSNMAANISIILTQRIEDPGIGPANVSGRFFDRRHQEGVSQWWPAGGRQMAGFAGIGSGVVHHLSSGGRRAIGLSSWIKSGWRTKCSGEKQGARHSLSLVSSCRSASQQVISSVPESEMTGRIVTSKWANPWKAPSAVKLVLSSAFLRWWWCGYGRASKGVNSAILILTICVK